MNFSRQKCWNNSRSLRNLSPPGTPVHEPPGARGGTMARMSPLFKARGDGKDPADRTVTLIGKPGCHLCDDARAVIEKVAGELGSSVEELDITQDDELYRKYWEQIPV